MRELLEKGLTVHVTGTRRVRNLAVDLAHEVSSETPGSKGVIIGGIADPEGCRISVWLPDD